MKGRVFVLTLLVLACVRPTPTYRPLETTKIVEWMRDFTDAHHVPIALQHLVDWHTGGPVVVLYTEQGTRACAITPIQAAYATLYHPFRCQWRALR